MQREITFLVIDDDLDDHEFFKEALKYLSVPSSVISVYNGIQGLEFLHKKGVYQDRKDADPDIIVIDLNMPVLDGFEVLKEIKKDQRLKTIPAFILTTSRNDSHRKECSELGCAGFFSKPPKLDELKEVIKKMVSGKTD